MRHFRLGGAKRAFLNFGKAVTVAASIMVAMPTAALACTQIYMGPQTTASGDTYVGRSEDYSDRHSKVFGIKQPQTNPTFSSYENWNDGDFVWTYQGTTYRYTFVRDSPTGWDNHTDAYGEAGTNEKGVSVSATDTGDYNDKVKAVDPTGADKGTNTGLGEYNAADIVLSCASPAREGVELLGKIIDEKGAYDCNSIIIADANETWDFFMVSGTQWCAVNMTKAAPDKVSVDPNMGNLKYDVDLSDTSVCLHSANLEETAKTAGSATYFDDGQLDVGTSYGLADPGAAQYSRYVQAHLYFGDSLTEGTDYTLGKGSDGWSGVATLTDPQLFFTPSGDKISLFTALRSYATRGENVSGLNSNENASIWPVGNDHTVETHMFDIRSGLDSSIATVQWEALSRAEFSVALPSYSALLTQVDTTIFPEDDASTWNTLDSTYNANNDYERDLVSSALAGDVNGMPLDYVLMDINTLAFQNRSTMASGTRAYLDALQKEIIAQQEVVDAKMQATDASGRTDLANKAFDVVSKATYAKLQTLLTEMRDFYNNGQKNADGSTTFTPSDYDATNKTLKDPLQYASKVVAPTITTQPASASYVQKDAATALSVQATDPAGTSLSYQWMKSTDGGKTWKKVSTSDTYTPATTDEGEAQYKVVVTNEGGLSTESDVATISVSKPVEPEPAGSMYRLYNPNSGEHFYTASSYEAGSLVKAGWRYEDIGWMAPTSSSTPVYRLYNPNAGDHHYTTSAAEKDSLVKAGWRYEGIGWYSDDAKGEPVYREYNPNAKAGAHNFTTNKAEDEMLANAGWNQEGIAWYGVKQ
ncbi:MAG: C69 family dipeptidase [Olsenella sp.]|nr:C69 family dipeptidase [Olsenella sp.]